jgi:folylpolyglutamate synthase/dihydropteroate synthase
MRSFHLKNSGRAYKKRRRRDLREGVADSGHERHQSQWAQEGVLGDKDYTEMIEILLPAAKRFFVVSPENPKALPSADLAARIRATAGSDSATVCETVKAGVNAALGEARKNDVIIALGSLYMVGAVRDCFE